MEKILITGASGFVGKNLISYLSKHGFECVTASIRFGTKLIIPEDIFAVVHLAGKAHDTSITSEPSVYVESNYELTKSVYDSFEASAAKSFIFLSSVKAVADTSNKPLNEDAIPIPKTPYGISKRQAEIYIEERELGNEKNYYILRPCMIHGRGNKGNLNLLYKFVKLGIPYPLSAFENKRSFLSIENLCFVIKELVKRNNIPSGIYHVADDTSLSTKAVINIMNTVIKKKQRFLNIPTFIIRFIAKIGSILHLPFDSEMLNKMVENYLVSNEKLKKALGNELPVKAEIGLQQTIESFNHSY